MSCLIFIYCYRKRKAHKKNYYFYSEQKNTPISKIFFPFNTFKNANIYKNKNKKSKTILDSNNVIMFNVDGPIMTIPNNNNNNNNNNINNDNDNNNDNNNNGDNNNNDKINTYDKLNKNIKSDIEKRKNVFKNLINKSQVTNHTNFINHIDSLLKKKNNRKFKLNKEENDTVIQMTEISFDGDYDYTNKDKGRYNYKLTPNMTTENNINTESQINKNDLNKHTINQLLESEKAKIWNSIPVSNSKDTDKYIIENIDFNSINTQNSSINNTIKPYDLDNQKTLVNICNPDNNTCNLDNINASNSSKVNNNNFRISCITDVRKHSKYRLSEPVINNKNINFKHNSLLSCNVICNDNFDEENNISGTEINECDNLVNKNSDEEKGLSWTSCKNNQNSFIDDLSKRVSGLLSLSPNKNNSTITEPLNENVTESSYKSIKKNENNYEEDSERLLLSEEDINSEIETERIQNSDVISINILDTSLEPQITSSPENRSISIEHSSSMSGSIRTWGSKVDSILNMYSNNFYNNNLELDDKYIFTLSNSDNDNNNTSLKDESKKKISFINANTLSYLNEIKNKLLKHEGESNKKLLLVQRSLNENNENENNHNELINISVLPKKESFEYGNSNSNNNDNDSSNKTEFYDSTSSYYSCKDTDKSQRDKNQIYSYDNSNILTILEDNLNLFNYSSNVYPSRTSSTDSFRNYSIDSNIDRILNDMLSHSVSINNRENDLISINDALIYDPYNRLIIPRKSSKRMSSRHKNINYNSIKKVAINNQRNSKEQMKKIPIRSSSINCLEIKLENEEENELMNQKYISYWDYKPLMDDELSVSVGDIIFIIKLFDDGKIHLYLYLYYKIFKYITFLIIY